jgi:hypothetical protein
VSKINTRLYDLHMIAFKDCGFTQLVSLCIFEEFEISSSKCKLVVTKELN